MNEIKLLRQLKRGSTAALSEIIELYTPYVYAIASNVTKISTIGGRGGLGARVVNAQPINGSFLDPIPTSTVSVSFSLYAKEQLIYTGVLQNGVIARLPAGYKSDTFSVRLQANTQVKAVTLADTPGNLRNA